jgi:hypothetical protein
LIRTAPAHLGGPDEWRILILASETLASARLAEEIERSAGGRRSRVLVVCPALTSAVRHWASDVDGGRAQAERRLDESLTGLRAAGIEAQGEIGDDDPLQAIEDALRTFRADEIIVATHPERARPGPSGTSSSGPAALRAPDRAGRDPHARSRRLVLHRRGLTGSPRSCIGTRAWRAQPAGGTWKT